jgi:hypothetical protein
MGVVKRVLKRSVERAIMKSFLTFSRPSTQQQVYLEKLCKLESIEKIFFNVGSFATLHRTAQHVFFFPSRSFQEVIVYQIWERRIIQDTVDILLQLGIRSIQQRGQVFVFSADAVVVAVVAAVVAAVVVAVVVADAVVVAVVAVLVVTDVVVVVVEATLVGSAVSLFFFFFFFFFFKDFGFGYKAYFFFRVELKIKKTSVAHCVKDTILVPACKNRPL